jgi:hypothetical protein
MPVEPNLSDLFHAASPPSSPLDAQEIIRRSRRRRLPARIGAGAALSLAVVGIGVAGMTGLNSMSFGTAASDSAISSESSGDEVMGTNEGSGNPGAEQPDTPGTEQSGDAGAEPLNGPAAEQFGLEGPTSSGGISRAPADKVNLCGGPVAEIAPNERGLELTVHFADATVGEATVTGEVTLTNNGTETVTGYTAASPAITLAQNNMVVWHSNGPMIMLAVDVNLAPGESMVYPATFSPVVCSVEDDLGESFRDDLPAAPAGQYQVSAAIDLMGGSIAELVSGPAATVTLN